MSSGPCARAKSRLPNRGNSYVSMNPDWTDTLTSKNPESGRVSDPFSCNMDLSVNLGRLSLKNPVLVASGTFGYAREMAGAVNFSKLGGIIPKTVTRQPRAGNPPPRTVETPSGMLNAIGLDNDGIDHFIEHHLPYLRTLPTAIVANIAGKSEPEFVAMAEQIGRES